MSNAVEISDRFFDGIKTGGAGLEIGTHAGRATRRLVAALDPATLTLVDPWVTNPSYQNRPFACGDDDKTLASAQKNVKAAYADRPGVVLLAQASADALPKVAKASLDWLYLDGCKYYREVLTDMEVSVTRLNPGGVLLGAGLTWGPQLGFPVKTALEDLASRMSPAPEIEIENDHFKLCPAPGTTLAPRPEPDRFLVVSTMKNEAPFILEWVAHYRSIGFTDFLVYTNDCDDMTVPLLNRLTVQGLVTHEPNKVLRRGPHKSALKYAQDHVLTAKADWLLICDVDEFLNLRQHDTIQEFLASSHAVADIIPFPWLIFGTGGQVDFKDAPITEQFRRCEPPPRKGGRKMRDVKTIFRKPEEIDRFGLHRPRFKDNFTERFTWHSPNGDDISQEMNTSSKWSVHWRSAHKAAYMNHYPLRSVEAYLVKKNRGRANHVKENLGQEYFEKWNLNSHHDKTIDRLSKAKKREFDSLMADQETASLHHQGVRQFRSRIDELLKDAVYQDLFETLKKNAGSGM